MKTILSILSFLLLLNPLAAQPTGQLADPAVPGGTTRPNANTGGASAGGGFVAGGQASAAATTGTSTRPSATTGGLGMPGVPGAGDGAFGTGTVVPGSLPASDEFAAGLLSEEAEQDLTSAAAAYRRTIQTFDRQRTEAANAIFRLGEVYRKMGRLEEAKVQYARILREFPDMVRLTELSHGLLLGEEGRAGTGTGPETGTTATGSASVTTSGRGPDDLDRILRESYGAGISDRVMRERYGLKHPLALDERVACISNLKQLGLAARIYAAEKDAVFPPSPALMSNVIAMTKVLVCPSDTTRQPATAWAEFDPDVHMTYEYLGAGVRENEPQRTLYRCPIHGHVALGDGQVHAQTTAYPAIQNKLELLGKQIDDLGEEYDRLARRQKHLERDQVGASKHLAEVEARIFPAQTRYDASYTEPEQLPSVINDDERYQRLKQEYEAAVLSLDDEAAKRAQERLKVWVEKVYRPQLEAEVRFAIQNEENLRGYLEALDREFHALKAEQDRLMEQQRELQARHSQLALLIPPATGS